MALAGFTHRYDISFYVLSTADRDQNVQMLRGLVGVNARSRVIPFKWLLGHPHRASRAGPFKERGP